MRAVSIFILALERFLGTVTEGSGSLALLPYSRVSVTNTQNGQSVNITMEDKCPGCAADSLDLSVGAFTAIGQEAQGVLPISWYFLS